MFLKRAARCRRAFAAAAGALALIATVAVQAAGASPAAATTIPVGSVQVVNVTAGGTGPSKTLSASCPADKPRVLGGGFTTTGTHIVVSELRPVAGNPVDSYRVTAGFDEVGTSGSWNLLVYAYCSNVAPGWQLISKTTASTSNPFNQAVQDCPGGKSVTGSGGQINGGAGQVELVTQGLGVSRMSAGGLEDITGFSGSWSVTAYAVCVTANPLDVRVVQSVTASDTTVTKSATATCPSGTRATGSAIWSNVPGNAINLRPNNITPVTVTGTARNDSGNLSATWDLTTYVFCAQ